MATATKTISLYGHPSSAACRLVAMTLETIGIPYEYVVVDVHKGEHLKPEFVLLNPQQTIPMIKDGNFSMTESRAIAGYLVSAHASNDSLYPGETRVRARIDQRLHFDWAVFFQAFSNVVLPPMMEDKEPESYAMPIMQETMGWVNDFIKPTGYIAGTDHLTIADLAYLATYSTIVATGAINLTSFTAINEWFEKVKMEVPNYEAVNGVGAEDFGHSYKLAVGRKKGKMTGKVIFGRAIK